MKAIIKVSARNGIVIWSQFGRICGPVPHKNRRPVNLATDFKWTDGKLNTKLDGEEVIRATEAWPISGDKFTAKLGASSDRRGPPPGFGPARGEARSVKDFDPPLLTIDDKTKEV